MLLKGKSDDATTRDSNCVFLAKQYKHFLQKFTCNQIQDMMPFSRIVHIVVRNNAFHLTDNSFGSKHERREGWMMLLCEYLI